MNKLTKILFSAITSVMLVTSAFAGEFAVTGGVKTTYTILSNTATDGTHGVGKGLGIGNEFTLSASGELDNGMTWSYAQDIDGATVQDDANITFGTDFGTIKVCVSECGMSTKFAYDASAYGVGSDNGYGGGAATGTVMQHGYNISGSNNVQYHMPADLLPFGITAAVGVTPGGYGGTANDSSHSVVGTKSNGDMTQYKVTMAPIDGLTLSADYYEFSNMGNQDARQKREGGSYNAKYSMGAVTVGYGETIHAPEIRMNTESTTAKIKHYENSAYSIGFAVNDSLSVSYSEESSERISTSKDDAGTKTRADVEMEIDTIDVAYTIGGATVSLSQSETTNASYTAGDEVVETILSLSMAF